jgi:hypothetical protein
MHFAHRCIGQQKRSPQRLLFYFGGGSTISGSPKSSVSKFPNLKSNYLKFPNLKSRCPIHATFFCRMGGKPQSPGLAILVPLKSRLPGSAEKTCSWQARALQAAEKLNPAVGWGFIAGNSRAKISAGFSPRGTLLGFSSPIAAP